MAANGKKFLLRRVRARRPTSASSGPTVYEWSIAMGGASTDEGGTMVHTVTLDRNGITPQPGEQVSVQIRTPTPEEFLVSFAGQTQAGSTDFTQSYTSLIASLVASTPGMVSAVSVPGAGMILTFSSSWNGTFQFTRTTINDPTEQGNKRSSFLIENPSQGVILDGEANYQIIDTYEAPVELVPTTIVISTDYHLPSAANGTTVGNLTVKDQNGATIAVDSLSIVGTEGGRYSIASGALKTTAVAADFEGGPMAGYDDNTGGIPFYNPVIQAVKGAVTIQQAIRIRQQIPEIAPTGDETDNTSDPATVGALRTAINSSTPNRTIQPTANDVFSIGGNVSQVLQADNITLDFNHRLIPFRGGKIDIGSGDNIIVRGGNFRAGGNDITGQNLDDRDAGTANHHSAALTNVLFENCTFANGVDELFSLIGSLGPFARKIRFYRCLFVEPLYEAGHSEGSHAFGMLLYNFMHQVVIHECWLHGSLQRSPAVAIRCKGIHFFNNLVSHSGSSSSQTGTSFYSTNSSVEHGAGGTMICEGNLYHSLSSNKARSIELNRCGTGSYFYIPESGATVNHWINYAGGAFSFAADPISRSNVQLRNGSSSSSLADFEPFKPHVYGAGIMPTSTAVEREALFDAILDNVGARAKDENGDFLSGDENLSKVDYDAIQNYRLTGTARRQTPLTLQSQYGTDWKGGTLGSMVAAP